jgi:hypothetical protein
LQPLALPPIDAVVVVGVVAAAGVTIIDEVIIARVKIVAAVITYLLFFLLKCISKYQLLIQCINAFVR